MREGDSVGKGLLGGGGVPGSGTVANVLVVTSRCGRSQIPHRESELTAPFEVGSGSPALPPASG